MSSSVSLYVRAWVLALAAVGAGVGYNTRYSLNNISLNPYSVTSVTGLNATAGIASMRLDYVGR